jgi:hypothetical protein
MKWHAVLLRSSRKNIKNNMKIQPWILPFKLSGQLLTKKKLAQFAEWHWTKI